MLKSCPKRLEDDMPKTGRFAAIYLEEDAQVGTVGETHNGMGAKAYSYTDYLWHDGKLYEDCSASEFGDPIWCETTPREEVEYYKACSDALMFIRIPTSAVVLEPIKTLADIEAEEETERLEKMLKTYEFGLAYGASPAIARGRQHGKTNTFDVLFDEAMKKEAA